MSHAFGCQECSYMIAGEDRMDVIMKVRAHERQNRLHVMEEIERLDSRR